MKDIRVISPSKYNKILAEALKSVDEFKAPSWVFLVKTSAHKERPTANPDFWYDRSASIMRQIYLRGVVGVNRLRTRYGGRKDRGSRPDECRKGGGKIIRTILQQAESAGFLEKTKGKKSGRKLTNRGKEFMEDLVK